MKKKQVIHKVIIVVILAVLSAIALTPVLLVLVNSFKTHAEIVANPLAWPKEFSFYNYQQAWELGKFGEGFANSIKLSGTAVVVGVLASAGCGYVIAGKKIKMWGMILIYFMLVTTVPMQLFLLPLYSTFVKLGLMGNPFAAGVVIAAWNLPLPIFLMRTFFLKIPKDLEEAARIDGAGTFQVFTKVMLPIVSPGLITVAVIVALNSWNEYLLSSTLLQGETNFTATIKFLNLNGTFSRDMSIIMSGAVIMIVPVVIVFLLLQKYFIDGMTGGSVKG